MGAIAIVLLMLLAVSVSSLAARATGWPAPLVQIALGAAIGFLGLPAIALEPEHFFLLFLPPLLFLDGWRIPKDALLQDAATVLRLALGLVLFTVLGMGLFMHWLLPGMPLPVAFALAAVLSPTDPIAVSSVASRTPVPPRVMHILEGESLLNDASGLVCMRFAVAAALTGSFSLPQALLSFVGLALGGVAVGAALAWGVSWLGRRAVRWLAPDAGNYVLVTLLLPFGAYLLAEEVHASGVLAAVAAGITMGLVAQPHGHGGGRLRRTAVWDMVQLVANGSVFVLLGQQLPPIVAGAARTVRDTGHQSPAWLVPYVLAIVAGLALLRLAWVWVSLRLQGWRARRRGEAAPQLSGRLLLVVSLAGVRGAVTLAGVMTLPLALPGGAPFPARDLAIALAAGVILMSLLLANFALPRLLRGLEPQGDDAERAIEDRVRRTAARAALRAIESAHASLAAQLPDPALAAEAADRLATHYRLRMDSLRADPDDEVRRGQVEAIERRLRLAALRAEREAIEHCGRDFGLSELARRRLLHELDLLEARYGG
ncbi:Na+/H+ antiporter [Azohydromonas aeria]|uniref:Na+/H+ antiporter n=1 Tax=Azohydromonas aeria TaxID=2590212 RepID=UPI0012F895F8|nr:Na+/H+ antiporter [Azohydromonas aeria]